MKKIFKIVSVFLIGLSGFSAFSAPSGGAKGGNSSKARKVEAYDWQGSSIGTEIPAWVKAFVDGNKDGIAKALGVSDKFQIFFFQNRGPDLDYLKIWTDNVDIRTEVANSISQAVGSAVEAAVGVGLKNDKKIDGGKMDKAANAITRTLTTVELNGLLKEAQFWIQFCRLKDGAEPNSDNVEDYDFWYEYYVVFTMSKANYEKQMNAALKTVDDNSSETSALKRALAASLAKPLGTWKPDSGSEYDLGNN